MEDDDDLIPLSALQHHLFCLRQCALIHIEQVWAGNGFTAEGKLLHERVDQAGDGIRAGVRVARSVPLRSARLGLTGRADVVELRDGRPLPVEYKRGRPKAHRADEVQLCAQALCLEEMFGHPVPEGALYYGRTRHRQPVSFDVELRRLTEEVIEAVRTMLRSGRTPAPRWDRAKCGACSLAGACQPRPLTRPRRVADWLVRQLDAQDGDC
ncbi:MAG: CRISPR-associated protein Cas4 [Alphaproteobacteria bacterium]|nr:CRISPR-associated protein Cas4 [Alphaproteobacteria bacterium]